jgi:hypothetical protein
MSPRRPQLPTKTLHEVFVQALEGRVVNHSALNEKPLEVDLHPPLPLHLRIYLYNATHPPGGRTVGEHKVQLMVPGQQRDQRASFDHSGGRFVLVVGYEPELSVFVLWDAGLYNNFPFSRNIQVKAETIYAAYATGIALQKRRLWGSRELVIVAYKTRLLEAIELRAKTTLCRLLEVDGA